MMRLDRCVSCKELIRVGETHRLGNGAPICELCLAAQVWTWRERALVALIILLGIGLCALVGATVGPY